MASWHFIPSALHNCSSSSKNRLLLPGNCYHLELIICTSLSGKAYALLAFHIFRTAFLFFAIKDRLCLPGISFRLQRIIVLHHLRIDCTFVAFVIFRTRKIARHYQRWTLPSWHSISSPLLNCSSSSRIYCSFLAVVIFWNL